MHGPKIKNKTTEKHYGIENGLKIVNVGALKILSALENLFAFNIIQQQH